ncbi:15657_t:CDS:1, partial [Gigaspora margarita]
MLKKETRTENHNLLNSIDLENASVDIFFEEFVEDEVLQIDIELPDFDMNDTDPVIEEFFDTRTFGEQNAIEEGSSSQKNTNLNED